MTRLLAVAACLVLASCAGPSHAPAVHSVPSVHSEGPSMADLVVEIHVPLTPAPGLAKGEYPYPWIMDVEDRISGLTLATDGAEDYDDGEELGPDYLFFLTGEHEAAVLAAAKRIATGPGVPAGAYVVVNDSEGDMGEGRRVELGEIG